MNSQIDFKQLIDRLVRDAARATSARQYFSNRGLRRWLSKALTTDSGGDSSFLADPLFEATFGWEPSGKCWGDLEGDLLSSKTIDALDYKGSSHRLERGWDVYSHQLQSIEQLLAPEPVSAVVTSGTGSGKTECFLVPIIEHLARQAAVERQPLVGVQALFLYPLNALINSQKERLSAWMSPFDGQLRYCLYNGETAEKVREEIPEQVLSRQRLREAPPPLLLTNATMLEYMLVRSEDTRILQKSQGKLQWIVLDEAHTYIGSQAAELSLLLRRVMIAFGVEAHNVRFIATSATIGDGGDESRRKLREFLSDLAGVSTDQIVVASGRRRVPDLDFDSSRQLNIDSSMDQLEALEPEALYQELSKSPLARSIRALIAKQPHLIDRLQVALVEEYGQRSKGQWLQLMTLLSRAVSTDGTAFLPLRMHLYHRTFAGLWACVNPECSGLPAELADDDNWHWGAVFIRQVECCSYCGSLALELVRCGECGAEHLKCDEKYDSDTGATDLLPRLPVAPVDEFGLDIEIDHWEGSGATDAPVEGESTDDDSLPDATLVSDPLSRMPRYLASRYRSSDRVDAVLQKVTLGNTGSLSFDGGSTLLLNPAMNAGFLCPVCHAGQTERRSEEMLFRSARTGMPFYSLVASRNLLASSPPLPGSSAVSRPNLPLDGRRILTFSDSRQGTARLSMSQYQDSERNFVRSQIYHQLAQIGSSDADVDGAVDLQSEIALLTALYKEKPSDLLKGILDKKEKEFSGNLAGPQSRACKWEEIRDKLARVNSLSDWSRSAWCDIAIETDIEIKDYANFCLYREFIRRPRAGNTLETLGLVGIRYPAIEAVSKVPPDVKTREITLDEWKTLLTLCVTFVFRSRYAVDVPPDWTRWLGDYVYPNVVGSPYTDAIAGRVQWPSTKSRRSMLVKILHKSLALDLNNEADKQWLDLTLLEMWRTLQGLPGDFINNTGDGFILNLRTASEFYVPETVWQCPFTGKGLDRVFRGVSPYSPYQTDTELALCEMVTMPRLPIPFWTPDASDDPLSAESWLETDEVVKTARETLLWENHSDLIARESRWYGIGEHSAQQSSKKLKRLEASFKRGTTNILNCSTTMEMGVDIGGISAVQMNNAPPGPANYLQRAGRAGRRGESASVALTLCSTSAHGAMLFHNPDWPFSSPIAVPRVSLDSADIVQRHVNALLLSGFLMPLTSQLKANCEWFFDRTNDEPSVCERFESELIALTIDSEGIRETIKRLLRGTALAQKPVESVVASTLESIQKTAIEWLGLVESMRSDLAHLKTITRNAEVTPAYKSVSLRLERVLREYLLSELARAGFLPGYGFPTDVVSFVTDTIEDLKKMKSGKVGREDNRSRSRGYPSRDLPVALREYAPGSDIALDGRVYRSDGVLLNWHLPPGDHGVQEVQALKHYWHCRSCGAGDTVLSTPPEQCIVCGSSRLRSQRFIEPGGFTVDLVYKPHNDSSQMKFMPVVPPRLNISAGHWVLMANRKAGRLRYSSEGTVLHRNPGREKCGYSVCLRCGRAAEQSDEGVVARVFSEPHYRLRGGKDTNGLSLCEASNEDYAIVKDLELGHQSKTSIAEIQFNHPETGAPLKDESVAWSLAVALRQGLVETLGLEVSEVGIAVQETVSESGSTTQSLFFYDQASGGAGYSENILFDLPLVFAKAQKLLHCKNECGKACHSCLISYDTQHKVEQLNRRKALEFIDEGMAELLNLQPSDCFFGESSRNESLPLDQALRTAIGRSDTKSLDIILSGEPDDWELAEWDFLQLLVRHGTAGFETRIAIKKSTFENLPDDQIRFIEALRDRRGLSLYLYKKSQPLKKNGELIAVVTSASGQCTGWATHPGVISEPGRNWCAEPAIVVNGPLSGEHFANLMEDLPSDILKKGSGSVPGQVRLTIFEELNGPVSKFSEKLWSEIEKSAPEIKQELTGAGPARKIIYTDKFIKTPLGLRLLAETVLGLPLEVLGADTALNVNTVEIKADLRQNRSPRLLDHDWLLDEHRRGVMPGLMRVMGWNSGAVDVRELSSVPHYRELKIEWPDGRCWSMQFDQGFGCWSTVINESFPFQESVANQVGCAARMNPRLVTRNENFKNYIFIDTSVSGR